MTGAPEERIPRFACGHYRTASNSKLVRNKTGITCATCFRKRDKLYRRAKRAAERGQ